VDSNTSASVFSAVLDTPAKKETAMPDNTYTQAQLDTAVQTAVAAAIAEKLAPVQASLDAANQRVTALETENGTLKTSAAAAAKDARLSAVKTLFADTNRQFSDEAAKPYMEMSGEVFSAVAADLRAHKSTLPGSLFSHTATDGKGGAEAQAAIADPHKFAAAITARVDADAKKGITTSPAQAASMIRAELSA
jgi:hypothetical protein